MADFIEEHLYVELRGHHTLGRLFLAVEKRYPFSIKIDRKP
jgi:hypothetical protein